MEKKKLKKNPFPGLRPFGLGDKDLFFGREEAVNELLRKMKGLRFIAVVGNSGSGKTSLVNGGLVPELLDGFIGQAGTDWKVATFQPGNDPIGNMAKALAQRKVLHRDIRMEPNYPFYVEETLQQTSRGLIEAYQTSDIRGKSNLLIIIDQFEELFKFFQNEKKAEKEHLEAPIFVNLLLTAVKQRDVPIYIVITVRADFISQTTAFRGLNEVVNNGQYMIPIMKREEFRKVITGPIRNNKDKISSKLRSTLINEIDGVQLPLLQHALMRTYDNWLKKGGQGVIDTPNYEEVGAIKSALSEHAEEAYSELTTEEEKLCCERIFKALSDKESDGKVTRLSLPFDVLCKTVGYNAKEVKKILDVFRKEGRVFFIPFGTVPLNVDTTISLTHESLIEAWERSRQWVEEERQSGETYMRLAEAANLHFQGKAGIYRNPELQIALNWRHDNQPNETWAKRYDPGFETAMEFLTRSKEQTESENSSKEEERFSQLERAKKFTRTVSIIAAVGVLLAIVSIFLFVRADNERRKALETQNQLETKQQEAEYFLSLAEEEENNAVQALAKAKAAQREAEIQRQTALENAKKAVVSERRAKQSAVRAKENAKIAKRNEEQAKENEAKAEKATNRAKVATLEAEKEAKRAKKAEVVATKNEEIAKSTRELALAETIALEAIALEDDYGDVKSLLGLEAYNIHKIYSDYRDAPNIHAGLYEGLRMIATKGFDSETAHKGAVRAMTMTNGADNVYTVGSDGKLYRWKVEKWNDVGLPDISGNQPDVYPLSGQVINSISLDKDNQYMVVGGKRGSVYIINQSTLNSRKLTAHDGAEVLKVGILPKGAGYISSGTDKTIREFEAKSNRERILFSNASMVTAMDVSKDGRSLVWAEGGNCYYYDIEQRKRKTLQVESNSEDYTITAVRFSNRGNALAIGYRENGRRINIVRYFQKSRGTYVPTQYSKTEQHTGRIVDIAFNKNDTKFATASYDGTAKVWDIQRLNDPATYLPVTLEDKNGSWAMSVTFSRKSDELLVGYRSGKVKFWALSSERISEKLCELLKRDLSKEEWAIYVGQDESFQKVRRNCK